jgi:hypothetical protein
MNKRRRRRRIWRTIKYKSESSRRKGTNFRDVCLLNINSLLHNCSLYEHVIFSLIRVVTGHRRPHSRSKVFITQHSMTHIIYKGCTRLKRYASPTEINCYGKQNTENECYRLFVCLSCVWNISLYFKPTLQTSWEEGILRLCITTCGGNL